MTIYKRNLKYTAVPIIIAVLLLIIGTFGIYYFIVFIHSHQIAYQITAFALAALGAYILYNRMKRRKQIKGENK
jgi:membrane protein implicated in regulation of membrane protease activity